ncbi:MAG: hypothetical protein MZU91_06585 [Desulfosudis oleivorans]|nr:hypothetical protein [Desulfosudis oleivorans]
MLVALAAILVVNLSGAIDDPDDAGKDAAFHANALRRTGRAAAGGLCGRERAWSTISRRWNSSTSDGAQYCHLRAARLADSVQDNGLCVQSEKLRFPARPRRERHHGHLTAKSMSRSPTCRMARPQVGETVTVARERQFTIAGLPARFADATRCSPRPSASW